jgi:mono/diheme cytochrome c family protein
MMRMRRDNDLGFRLCRAAASLVLLLLLAACDSPEKASGPADGEVVYGRMCAVCHGFDGEGRRPAFPPLAGSEWVTDDDERLIRIVLDGLSGEITVRGERYNGLMLGFRQHLTDEEIAAVLNHVRSSWGNDASPITPAEVARVRGEGREARGQ